MNVSELEPAERDPKAIRRTVIILFILMFVGGTAIWWKYMEQNARDQEEVVEGRSPRISRLTKNFAGVCQDGESRGLDDLEGKVWVVAPIVPNRPEENRIQLAKMKDLAEHYKGRKDFHLVCLSVADPKEHGYEELAKIAEEVGADIDQWWFMAAGEEKMIGFLKDHLKMAHINERSGAEAVSLGKHDVPAQLRVVDQSRRVRGEYQHFDFDFAQFKTEETKKALEKEPGLLDRLQPDERGVAEFYLDMDAEWTKRMYKVIDYTFTETEVDEDPDYITAIMVVVGILGFIIFQGVRLRKRVKG
jgi:cytochrome oxidase Cu insertion factor (SCO1/SenC/PrrC family)